MNALMDINKTVDDVDGLLTETFGRPAPPKEEILRHKWLESEKAGRDIGLPAAVQDWSVKHYEPWKTAHVAMRRHDYLVAYVMVPLIFCWVAEALTDWWTGFDILASLFQLLPNRWII